MASTACAVSCQRYEVRFCCGKSSQKRRQEHAGFPTHTSQNIVYGVSRRGLLALSVGAVTEVFIESRILENESKALATQDDDKSAQKVDAAARAPAEGLDNNKSSSPLDGLLSIFDTTEKSKSGKLLPKGYLKSARQVVKTLKESLKEESGKEVDVRRSADSAKAAIRDYLQNWRGQKSIESEDSYKALEGAIKVLGKFYGMQGPRAVLPADVKLQILSNLELADASL